MIASCLTKNDYIKILELYNIKIPSNNLKLKQMADNILCNKLCRRIVSPTQKSKTRCRNKSIKNSQTLYCNI